jgi:DNA uptake protein ComE-like DNA-binding protein
MEKLNVNKATADELTQIVHIGKIRAQKIIDNRPFRDIYELSKILGIGEKRMYEILERHRNILIFSIEYQIK